MSQQAVKFAYWVPNVSGGLVVSKIEQRTHWGIDYNRKLAQLAEAAGFEYGLTQIRFTAGYGADNQHESVAFSHALLAATTKLKVIAAILPGPWQPALAAKQLATIDQLTNGRIAVNIVSGWFKGEFQASASTGWSTTNAIGAPRNLSAPSKASGPKTISPSRATSTASTTTPSNPSRWASRKCSRAAVHGPRGTWQRGCRIGFSPTATPRKASRPRSMTFAPRLPQITTRSKSA